MSFHYRYKQPSGKKLMAHRGTSSSRPINSLLSKFSPGPGTYEHSSTFIPRTIRMKGKRRDEKKEKTPGPGHYPHKSTFSTRGIKIQKQIRRIDGRPKTPGPKYSIRSSLSSKGAKFSYRCKKPKMSYESVPGPGSYSLRGSIGTGRMFQMGGKRRVGRRSSTPGPGMYSSSKNHRKYGQIYVSMKGRNNSGGPWNRNTPGPGTYHKASTLAKGGNKFSFKSRKWNKVNSSTPGPGTYKLASTLSANSKSLAFRTNFYTHGNSTTPGPGVYNMDKAYRSVSTVKTRPRYSIRAKLKNTNILITHSPGPGTYVLKSTLARIGKSIAGRTKITATNTVPGPGLYNIKSTIGVGGKKTTMKGKYKSRISGDVPGPGHYLSGNMRDTRVGITLKGKRKVKRKQHHPSPFSYQPNIWLTNNAPVFGTGK